LEALPVSPILVRPVREQLEHDRLIRLLQAKLKRKFDPGINPGAEQNAPVGTLPTAVFPDLVLYSVERGRRLQGVIEVETGESVNHLEALAQWTHLARLRVPFYLYVPSAMVDVARRLCEDNHITVNEIWSYHSLGDQVRFNLVHRSREVAPVKSAPKAPKPAPRAAKVPAAKKPAARPKSATSSKAKPAKSQNKTKSKPKPKPKKK